MSEGVNEVRLLGNIGKAPEYREGERTNVLRFSMATETRFKNKKTNEWESATEWHRVVAFGARARGLNKILRSGSRVYVMGSLKTSKWVDNDQITRYSTDIIIQRLVPLTPKSSGGGSGGGGSGGGYDPDPGGYDGDPGYSDEDIPF